MCRPPPRFTLFPYTTLFRSIKREVRTSFSEGRPSRLKKPPGIFPRSEEHTSELQSRENLVCRLLLEKKKLTVRHHLQHSSRSTPMLSHNTVARVSRMPQMHA